MLSAKSVVGLPFSSQRSPRSLAKRAVNPCFSIIRFGPVSHFPTPSRAAFGSPAEFLSVLGRRHRHCGPSRYRKPRHCQRPGELFCSFVLSKNPTCNFPECDATIRSPDRRPETRLHCQTQNRRKSPALRRMFPNRTYPPSNSNTDRNHPRIAPAA